MPKLTEIRKQALDEIMKEALFEATIAVLSDYGVDGMTMDRVAAAAGMAKGSLYRYFRSKRELLEFVYEKVVDPLFQIFEEQAQKKQPAIDNFVAQLRALLEHAAVHVQVHRLLFEDEVAQGLLQSSERRTIEAACHQLAVIFRQGIEEGVFRPQDPVMLARMYLGLFKAVLQSQPELETREQRESIQRLIMGTFLNGIVTEEGRISVDN